MNRFLPIAVVFILAAMAVAQDKKPLAPKLIVAMPLCIKPGETMKFTVRGSNLETVSEVRVHEPKSRGKIVAKGKKVGVPNNFPVERIGDSEIEIEIVAAKEISGATLSFSAIGPGGESNVAKIAIADGVHRLLEKEPNDGFDKAQLIDCPATVEGTIDRVQDSDVYQFRGKAGETIRIEVQAAKLGSPADLMMTVYDSEKRIVDSNDDANGSADPMLQLTLPKDGTYFIALIEMHDLGGKMFPYRLILSK